MNPLTAHLERYQKQPPLIKEEEEAAGVNKRPFSNCVLFVLLAVFVFFLACLAVYTAVAMGIPVEKNEAAPLKSDLSSTKAQVLSDSVIDKTLPKELKRNATNKIGNDSVIVSTPTRLRIQIFIKGKEAEDSKEHSDLDQNNTEETIFNTIPKSRIFLRRIIINNNGLNKPEIDSSEEISSGSDESIKDVLGFRPFGIPNAPNPLDLFLNLLKLTEAPIDNFLNILDKQKSKQSNTTAIEFPEKSSVNDNVIPPKDQIEEFLNSFEKQINEPNYNQSKPNEKLSSNGKRNDTRSEKQDISPIENEKLNSVNHVNDAQNMITNMEKKQHYNENMTPLAIRTPVFRFFRFISPDHPHVERQETYSPMYQRTIYQHPNQYSHGMTRLPYSHENMPNKGSFSGGHDSMYKTYTTVNPTTIHQTQTTIPPQAYSTTPNSFSVPLNKNNYRENVRETINHQPKETQNQRVSTSNKQEQSGMIDRMNTENIKPLEDFFKYSNL